MSISNKQKAIRTAAGSFSVFAVFIVLLLHNAWGDERYILRAESIRQEISRIDTQITVIDQEILFAEDEREKAKFEAIRSIYQREKEALREKLKD